jgi:hypothetical protein
MMAILWVESCSLGVSLKNVLDLICCQDQWQLATGVEDVMTMEISGGYCTFIGRAVSIVQRQRSTIVTLLGRRILSYAISPTNRLLPILANSTLASELAEANLTTAVAYAELHDARNRIGTDPFALTREIARLLASLIDPLVELQLLVESRQTHFLRTCVSQATNAMDLTESVIITIDSLREQLWSTEQCRLLKRNCA